jgi:hypothetical protein
MNIDEIVAKAAADKGRQPLADTLGCKVSEAFEVLDQVRLDGFFEEMAKHGHVPQSEEEAASMVEMANNALAWSAAQSKQSSQRDLFKTANEILANQLGQGSPEASRYHNQTVDESRMKAASFAQQPGVAELMLAAMDAENLLAE